MPQVNSPEGTLQPTVHPAPRQAKALKSAAMPLPHLDTLFHGHPTRLPFKREILLFQHSADAALLFLPFAFHLHSMSIPFAFYLHSICIPCAFHLHSICISFAFHLHFICISFAFKTVFYVILEGFLNDSVRGDQVRHQVGSALRRPTRKGWST